MKHFISIIILSYCSVISLVSQNKDFKRSSLVFSTGISQPFGKMAESNFKDSSSGFAKTGMVYKLQFQCELERGWSFYISTQFAQLGFDREKFQKVNSEENNWKITEDHSNGYAIGSIDLGFSYEIYRRKNISMAPFLGFGISYCRNKSLDYTIQSSGMSVRLENHSDLVNCKNFQYGINTNYALGKRTALVFGISLQHQSPLYQNSETITIKAEGSNSVSNTNIHSYALQQNFTSMTLGLRYMLK